MDLFIPTTTLETEPIMAARAIRAEGWRGICAIGGIADLRAIHAEGPVTCQAVTTPWLNLASDDRFRFDQSLAEVREAIHIGADRGARWLIVSPGYGVYGGLYPSGELDSEKVKRPLSRLHLMRALDRLASDTERAGMAIILRQQAALGREELLTTAEEADSLLKTLGVPHVGLGLDLGHIKITARQQKVDADNVVEACLEHARMVFLHGNEGDRDAHDLPKASSWELSKLERREVATLPLVYDPRRQPITELRAFVSHLCESGHYTP